jgi:MFS family permease
MDTETIVNVNALELRAALVLAAMYMFRMLGLFMVMPVLVITAQAFDDYSPLLVGIAIGGYGLMQAILQIPMGSLSDRFGRKPVILVGLIVFALGSAVAAQADSLVELTLGRFLQGGGAIASAIMALATDVSREKARPIVMAVIGIAIGFSFYIAVLVGPLITASFGLPGIFWLTTAGALASIPMLFLLVPNPPKTVASLDVVPSKSGLSSLLVASQLWRLNVSVFLLHLAITLLFVPFPLILSATGFELGEQWKVYTPVLIISIVGLSLLMMIARANRENKAMMLAGACMMSGLGALMADAITVTTLVMAGALFFSGFNFLEATFPSMVSKIAPPGKKGSAMGLYASFQFSGAFAGGLIAGWLLESFTPNWVFAIGIATTGAMLLICFNLKPVPKVSRLVFEANDKALNTQTRLAKVLALEGVVDARWSDDQTALHLKVNDSFDPMVVEDILS